MTRASVKTMTCPECQGRSRSVILSGPRPASCAMCLGLGFIVWRFDARPEPMTEEQLVRQVTSEHAKRTGKNHGWQLFRLSRRQEIQTTDLGEPATHHAFGVTMRVSPAAKIRFVVTAVCVVCDAAIWSGYEIFRKEETTLIEIDGRETTMSECAELARFHATQCLLKWWSEQT